MISKKKTERIPVALATEMVKAFEESSKQQERKSSTKAVWFPAEQILEIAKLLETGTHDGLRIYFARYLTDQQTQPTNGLEGINTLLLVPTIEMENGNQDDTDEITNGGNVCPGICIGIKL